MPSRKIDLDAILGEDSLELILGGKAYVIKDAPMEFLLRIQKSLSDGAQLDAAEILRSVLGPLGYTAEDEAKVGTKAAILASAVIADHFTVFPESLAKLVPGAARLMPARPIGPESSAAS